MGPTRCTPVAYGFKGSERGSKLANNGENIAYTPQIRLYDLRVVGYSFGSKSHSIPA